MSIFCTTPGNIYVVKQLERRVPLVVPIQFGGAKPNPIPTAAKMRLQHKTNGVVLERSMNIDSSPTDRINAFYEFQAADWASGDFAPGHYRAVWILTQNGLDTVAPGIGYDTLVVEAVL